MKHKNKTPVTILMVHPFDNPLYETQADYLAQREALLRNESDLFILTNDVEKTKKRLDGRNAGIISTEYEANPKPKMGWKLFSEILRDYEELIFCGAELHLKDNGKPYTGCVLDAFQKVSHPNKWIYLAGCWVGE